MADWLDRSGTGGEIDVPKMLGGDAGDGIADLVATGALVSLSLTSDGGALGVTVTVDGRWRRDYFRTEDELTLWLAEAVPAVAAARGSSVPPARKAPRRRAAKGL